MTSNYVDCVIHTTANFPYNVSSLRGTHRVNGLPYFRVAFKAMMFDLLFMHKLTPGSLFWTHWTMLLNGNAPKCTFPF